MNGAWIDGAPRREEETAYLGNHGFRPQQGAPSHVPSDEINSQRDRGVTPGRTSVTLRAANRVSRIRQFEGLRGYSSRATLAIKYVNYFLLVLLGCGLTEYLTSGVRYASKGGMFMLVAVTVVSVVGAGSTLFYVNLRTEIVERVRHYVFGIMILPGTLLAGMIRALQEWEWVNEGGLGSTLQAALPAIFLASVFLPAMVFIKEMIGIRTLHRTRMDDEESVQLWTRQDGLQR